jgi:hypothetical protein
MNITINKNKFLDWRFSEKEDSVELAKTVINRLRKSGKANISLDDLFNDCGTVPSFVIDEDTHKNIPESERIDEFEAQSGDVCFEILPDVTFKVNWTEGI